MIRLINLFTIVVFVAFVAMGCGSVVPEAASVFEKNYHRFVILSDLHLPGKEIAAKENVIKTINSWDDVEGVIVLGDICFQRGTTEEYTFAKQFFSQLKKSVYFINGNHEYFYNDLPDPKGRITKASPETQAMKLELFKKTFNLPELYYTRKVGDYFLVFLAVDVLGSPHLAQMSQLQLDWLQSELNRNKKLATVVFFHAPLNGTLSNYNQTVNTTDFVAQPENKIRELILRNPQVFIWVSGHTHTPATNESYVSDINIYEKQVTNIHTCDMNRATIWTNSLYLYPGKVLVRTFDHKKNTWLKKLDRTIPLP